MKLKKGEWYIVQAEDYKGERVLQCENAMILVESLAFDQE